MSLTFWTANRVISIILYIGVIFLTAWGGIRAINYSIDSKFYKDFLIKWEISIKSINHIKTKWPEFNGKNHVRYMDELVLDMQKNQVPVPTSNTQPSYIYIMNKIGPGHEKHKIFALCLPDKLILYDISKESFERIDRFVDGKASPEEGRFQGWPEKGKSVYTGILKL